MRIPSCSQISCEKEKLDRNKNGSIRKMNENRGNFARHKPDALALAAQEPLQFRSSEIGVEHPFNQRNVIGKTVW
jgi:hypothetical protein